MSPMTPVYCFISEYGLPLPFLASYLSKVADFNPPHLHLSLRWHDTVATKWLTYRDH